MLFIFQTLVRWRKLIVLAGLGTAFVTGVITFFLPKWYTATSSVFPPETKGFMPSYMNIVQSLQIPMLGPSATGTSPNTIYIDVMLSRRVGTRIVEEFNLMEIYDAALMGDAIEKLHKHLNFNLLDNGLLTIIFEDRDPERAAAIANRFVELLDEFNQQINISKASKTREFIEGQMDLHMRDLRDAEESLRQFQKANQALQIDEQLSSAIDIIAELSAEAISLEVEMEILSQYTSKDSEEYLRKKRQYDEISKQLGRFQTEAKRDDNDLVRSFFPAFDRVPDVALEMARHMRRVKVEEKVFEMLIQEYERARIEEARDTPTVSTLDAAVVPERRSRPKRKILVLVGGIVGLGWSSLLAIFVTVWREDRERKNVVKDLVQPIATDFRSLVRKKK